MITYRTTVKDLRYAKQLIENKSFLYSITIPIAKEMILNKIEQFLAIEIFTETTERFIIVLQYNTLKLHLEYYIDWLISQERYEECQEIVNIISQIDE